MQYPPRPSRQQLLLKAISDASTYALREKPVTKWLLGERDKAAAKGNA